MREIWTSWTKSYFSFGAYNKDFLTTFIATYSLLLMLIPSKTTKMDKSNYVKPSPNYPLAINFSKIKFLIFFIYIYIKLKLQTIKLFKNYS